MGANDLSPGARNRKFSAFRVGSNAEHVRNGVAWPMMSPQEVIRLTRQNGL